MCIRDSVYALDSGTGQLAPSLRADARVTDLENRNARYMQPADFGSPCDMAVSDVSFVSQTLILPQVPQVVRAGGLYIGLVKPQFECGREALHKNGIVRDKKYRLAALTRVYDCMRENHMTCLLYTSLDDHRGRYDAFPCQGCPCDPTDEGQ